MRKFALFLLISLLLPVSVLAQTVSSNQAAKKKAVYFYSETCSHCAKVNQYFQDNGIYDKYDIQKREVGNPDNLKALNQFFDAFGVKPENRGYPVVFFGNQELLGDQPIINNFVKEINQVNASSFPTPQSIRLALAQEKSAPKIQSPRSLSSVPLPLLMLAALADALNPCALAVLILLLATVIASGGKRRALLSGLAFSFAVFSSYFMMGLGLYKAITVFSLPHYFSLAVAILAILIGLANLKDVVWYGKVFIMEVPRSWRPNMQGILKKVTGPIGALGAGYLVSLFLVPCASGPYLVLLGKLAQRVDVARTIPLLIVYNLIFVLPMIIITLAMYFGSTKIGKLEHWRKNHLRTLHAVTAGIMLFLGLYLLYYSK